MTDAELIARLRLYGSKFHHEFGHNEAADRIEAMTGKLARLQNTLDYMGSLTERLEETEDKLAKAVELLEMLVKDCEADGPLSKLSIKYFARATLAEIKGEIRD